MGCRKSSSKTEVYRNTVLTQETRNRQPNSHLKQLEKENKKKKKKNPKLVEGKNSERSEQERRKQL